MFNSFFLLKINFRRKIARFFIEKFALVPRLRSPLSAVIFLACDVTDGEEINTAIKGTMTRENTSLFKGRIQDQDRTEGARFPFPYTDNSSFFRRLCNFAVIVRHLTPGTFTNRMIVMMQMHVLLQNIYETL